VRAGRYSVPDLAANCVRSDAGTYVQAGVNFAAAEPANDAVTTSPAALAASRALDVAFTSVSVRRACAERVNVA
jgi:hypothetical protein